MRGMDTATLIETYDARVPRYTSYPTAPHFSEAVSHAQYAAWLAALPAATPLSLYLHVPFCEQLCLYCGCNTAVVRHDGPRIAYGETMLREIGLVAAAIGRRLPAQHIHFGGGTPTALPAETLRRIMAQLRHCFEIAPNAEIAIELDPRHVPADRLDALVDMGVTRASLGVQDFSPVVQHAVGRVQCYALTRSVAENLRNRGIRALNLDLMYGLPYQTTASVRDTAHRATALDPDRIAVFGYAHVPWMKRQQRLLPEDKLPGAVERFEQRAAIEEALLEEGYVAIGLDHFARPDDPLALAAQSGAMRRNFQGYTTDTAPALLGFGASAIGSLPQGYAQNHAGVPAYNGAIAKGELPIARGIAVSAEDLLRRHVIESIMCRLRVNLAEAANAEGFDPEILLRAAPRLQRMQQDGLITWNGAEITVTDAGRPFVRSVACAFDTYLTEGAARHARAI